ncbi:unnamed protein product [Victoria cruziana]
MLFSLSLALLVAGSFFTLGERHNDKRRAERKEKGKHGRPKQLKLLEGSTSVAGFIGSWDIIMGILLFGSNLTFLV